MITGRGKNTKEHRDRKNPRSRDAYEKDRRARRDSRPKQRWVGGETVAEGGHWERP